MNQDLSLPSFSFPIKLSLSSLMPVSLLVFFFAAPPWLSWCSSPNRELLPNRQQLQETIHCRQEKLSSLHPQLPLRPFACGSRAGNNSIQERQLRQPPVRAASCRTSPEFAAAHGLASGREASRTEPHTRIHASSSSPWPSSASSSHGRDLRFPRFLVSECEDSFDYAPFVYCTDSFFFHAGSQLQVHVMR